MSYACRLHTVKSLKLDHGGQVCRNVFCFSGNELSSGNEHLQGTLLKRHKAMLSYGDSGARRRLTPGDLAVGAMITLYARTYLLIDADAATRAWFTANLARDLAAPLAVPEDPSAKSGAARCRRTLGPPSPRIDDLARFNEARLGKPTNVLGPDTLRQFLVRAFLVIISRPLNRT
jgi:DUF1126 PH-like domain